MGVPPRKPWTQVELFAWAEAQERRYELDGVQPVAMGVSTIAHNLIARNLYRALHRRFPDGCPCRVLGPNAGLATTRSTIRYPDALITCSKQELASRKVTGAVVVFEVISESTARIDRILKVREYATVATLVRYVMVESAFAGLTVLARKQPDELWTTSTLLLEDSLPLPEVGLELPVAEPYRDLDFSGGVPQTE